MLTSAKPSICRICKENCGILVRDDGQRIEIRGNPQHPISKGFICFKGKNFGDVHNSPERLRQPMLKKGSDWVEIPYEEALEVLASNLQHIRENFGPESVVFYKGESLKHQEITDYMRHLSYAFGSPNYLSVGSLCHYSMLLGHSITYGGIPKPDFEKNKTAIIWGSNPAASLPRFFTDLKRVRHKGTRLVVIDPARTQTARLADLHLPITPGSDGFLALAFIKQAIENPNISTQAELTRGWDQIVELLNGISYGDLLQQTGIKSTLFDKSVSLIFDNLPAWTLTGLGLELQPCGVQAIRAIACLQSILDPHNRPTPVSIGLKPLPGMDQYPTLADPIGAKEAPLYTDMIGEAQGMFLTRAILEDDPYPVRAMLITGGNPLLTFPAFHLQKEAFNKLGFLAVFDLFMTPTALLADLVFPAADFLDNLELHDYGQAGIPYIGLIQPATSSSVGWPAWKFLFELARKLGLKHLFPWDDNRSALSFRLSGLPVALEDLETSPGAVLAYEPREVSTKGWYTTDGKVHYYSEKMESSGNPALPIPSSLSLPFDTNEEFPFWLSTGDRILTYQHSQYRQIPTYRQRVPEPFLDIHPEVAEQLNIANGDPVVVVTRHGQVEIRANLNDEVRKDCIRMPHGWGEANANELTGAEHFDPLSGFPWLRALPARVEKKW